MRVVLITSVLVMTCLFSSAQTGVSVLTQHNDINRTGWNNKETILNPANVSSGNFGRIGTFNVDDELYAQPLIVNNITVGNHTGSVLYAATVNNTVYAFDADDATDTSYLWKVSLNPSGQRAPGTADLTDPQLGAPCEANYLDFSGRLGIVGTPVINTSSNTLYVATKTIDGSGNFYAYLNALDLTTGQQKSGSPHLMTATVSGSGAGSVAGQVSYQAKFQNQRPALLLYNNVVYVASASYCDWGPYHGWVLGFDANTLNFKYAYNSTPDGGLGGIWMAGQGISVGQDGNLYLTTGNGSTTPGNTIPGSRSSSLLKLSPQLTLLDWFTPANYDYLDQNDLDYGSDGALIIPNSTTTVSGSKEGISYVVDYNNMGRFDSLNRQVKDTLEFNPNRTGFVHVHGSPVYAQLNGKEFVYGWSESFNLRQFTFDRNTGTFLKSYQQGTRTLDNGMPGAMLSLSSNGSDTSSAIVWACFPTSGNANHQVRPGTFGAYRAKDVSANELWNSDQDPNDGIGNFAKFNTPTIANGKVFVPTFSKAIKIYGIFPPDSTRCFSNGTGLLAEYFSNSVSSDPFPSTATVTKTEPTINFSWGPDGPPGISVDYFKARFSGSVQSFDSGKYTFYVTSDDGYRLWINNELLLDKWINKSASEDSVTIILPKCTWSKIKLEYFENLHDATCILKWSGPRIAKQVIPTPQLYPPDTTKCVSNGTGLSAEYFSNSVSSNPFPLTATITKTEPTINFSWGAGSPPGISVDYFKARFTGSVQSRDSGKYTFYVTSDDGYRLWINNQLLLDKWINKSASEDTVTLTLPDCTKNDIKLEYFENLHDATCILKWSGPGMAKQVIPTLQLYPPGSPVTCGDPTGLQSTGITISDAVISWTTVSNAISYSVDYKLNSSGTWINVASATISTSIILSTLQPGSLYNWRVRATCSGGAGNYVASQFTTLTPPACDDPAGLQSTGITTGSATVSWTTALNAISYTVDYKLNSSITWINVASATISTSIILSTLQPGSLYDWRVSATCSGGTGNYVASQFTTSPAACGDPAGLQSTGITTGSATVSWTAASNAISYTVDYKLNSSVTWINVSSATTSTSINLSTLQPGSLYDWRVRATCSGGTGNYVASQFTTLALPTCGDAAGLQSTGITTSSATVSWTAASNAISYSVDYTLNSSGTWINAASATTSTSINLSTLQPGSLYNWRVRATCSGSTGNYVVSQFTTLAQVICNTPFSLSSSSITTTGATVSWSAVSGAVSYDVSYSLSGANSWTNVATATASTSAAITGLNPSTVYDWRVRTNCSSGSSGYASAGFTTANCDIYEPNNTFSSAAHIPVGTNITGRISSSTDVDYFTFSTTSTQTNLLVTLTNLPANYNLALYQNNGKRLQLSAKAGTSPESIAYNNQSPAIYKVLVSGVSGAFNTTGCYILNVTIGSNTFSANIAALINTTEIARAGLKIYPVPASSAITISFDAVAPGKATVAIINQLGQEVYNKQVDISDGNNVKNINVGKLASGIYMLRLKTNDSIQSRKLIINN